jgi:hypothetical protein
LSSYRRFFRAPRGGDASLGDGAAGEEPAPFETYLAEGQSGISCAATDAALRTLGVTEPPLDPALLRRYVAHYVREGVFPPCPWGEAAAAPAEPPTGLKDAVARHLPALDEGRSRWEEQPLDAGRGLLNQVAALRLGADLGLRRYRVRGGGAERELVVKAKADGGVTEALIAEVAALRWPALARALREHPQALELERSHLRELALYTGAPPDLRRHMPRSFGTSADAARGVWSVALEALPPDTLCEGPAWTADQLEAAVAGAAAVHGAFYGHTERMAGAPWMAPRLGAAEAGFLRPLWRELAAVAGPLFARWAGPAVETAQACLIADVDEWWAELDALPQALVHNDFNPRNLAFRREGPDLRLCAFDWELARVGAPQHDLAELLCFVLPEGAGADTLGRWLERHRALLAARAGAAIAEGPWLRGFALSLGRLLLQRLPLYALGHGFQPQPFLPRVVRNWAHLRELTAALEAAARRRRVA